MKKEGVIIFIFVFTLIFLSVLISASFEVSNSSSHLLTQKHYNLKENIKGWINISFSGQSLNSLFEDSFGNKISLEKLLKSNPDFNYECNTLECVPYYSFKNPEEKKTFNLIPEEPKIIGFKLIGKEIIVRSLDFDLKSNVGASCENQIEIDLLNDNDTEWINDKSTIGECSNYRNYGCFEKDKSTVRHNIVNLPNLYCQRIELPIANSFKIGAWIERNGETGNLTMALYNLNKEPIEGAECLLPKTGTNQEIYCEIEYPLTSPEEFYVCIYSVEGEGKAMIKGYSLEEGSCGFYGNYGEESAYNIFVEPKKFDSIGTLNVANILMRGGRGTLASRINNYIENVYKDDSVFIEYTIPLKIISNKSQSVTLENLEIDYYSSSGNSMESNFYDLDEMLSAKADAPFQKLYLDKGNFSAPSQHGNYTFNLDFDKNRILSENFSVEKIPTIRYITPTSTAYAVPTKFIVGISYPTNISEYIWEFSSNEIERTYEREIIHTYPHSGTYELKVTIIDSRGFNSSRTFEIRTVSPDSIVREKIKRFQNNLEFIFSEIENFPEFYQEQIEFTLEVDELESRLREIQKKHSTANTEEDYIEIVEELSEFGIPKSVYKSREAKSIFLYPSSDKVNMEILEKIGGGNYNEDRKDEYLDAIVLWNQENIETNFDFNEITTSYEDYEEPILKIFELNLQKSEYIRDKPYLIIKKMENLKFDDRYSEEEESGYVYIDLSRIDGTITFSTTEDINFDELPAFISPGIDSLSLIEEPSESKDEKRWGLFIGIMAALIIIVLFIYLILQEWYNRKYETYLFRDRDNLFNLLTYIKNSKKKGMSNKEIISKLKKSGWNSEQIRYVINKYEGKNTGMLLQIPIPLSKKLDTLFNKIFNKKKNAPKRDFHNKRRTFPSLKRNSLLKESDKFKKYK